MKKFLLFLLSILGINIFIAKQALAVCPLCTIAVGAGVGFSRWLGVDDSLSGLWIGGLTVSMIVWTLSWFDKKNIHFYARTVIITIAYYLLIVVPLHFSGLIGNPANAIYSNWLDKLIIGIVVGSIGFWFGASLYEYLKEKNNGRAYFPYQKVVMPIAPLIILSFVFYWLTK